MKRIILTRHSKTEVITDEISDIDRELKPRGYKDAELISKELKQNGFIPDIIITSHAIRAVQTAEEMAKEFNIKNSDILKKSFIYTGYTTSEFLNFVNQIDNSNSTILVIGHNPDIAMVGMNLANDNFFHFPTTASAVISFAVNQWSQITARSGKTELFLSPRVLKDEG